MSVLDRRVRVGATITLAACALAWLVGIWLGTRRIGSDPFPAFLVLSFVVGIAGLAAITLIVLAVMRRRWLWELVWVPVGTAALTALMYVPLVDGMRDAAAAHELTVAAESGTCPQFSLVLDVSTCRWDEKPAQAELGGGFMFSSELVMQLGADGQGGGIEFLPDGQPGDGYTRVRHLGEGW